MASTRKIKHLRKTKGQIAMARNYMIVAAELGQALADERTARTSLDQAGSTYDLMRQRLDDATQKVRGLNEELGESAYETFVK